MPRAYVMYSGWSSKGIRLATCMAPNIKAWSKSRCGGSAAAAQSNTRETHHVCDGRSHDGQWYERRKRKRVGKEGGGKNGGRKARLCHASSGKNGRVKAKKGQQARARTQAITRFDSTRVRLVVRLRMRLVGAILERTADWNCNWTRLDARACPPASQPASQPRFFLLRSPSPAKPAKPARVHSHSLSALLVRNTVRSVHFTFSLGALALARLDILPPYSARPLHQPRALFYRRLEPQQRV